MRYLIRTLIFAAALVAVVLVVRDGLGVTRPAGGVAYWSCVALLAFAVQMLINDLLACFRIAGFKPYVVTDSDIPAIAKEIPVELRLLLLYPLLIVFLCNFVWYFAGHATTIWFRSVAP